MSFARAGKKERKNKIEQLIRINYLGSLTGSNAKNNKKTIEHR